MKRIVASVGMVAIGATGLQAELLPSMTTESGKPWTVGATLRGFYDDNVNTVPDNFNGGPGFHRSTTGFEVSPFLKFSFPMEQTTLSFGYVYSLKYYDNTPIGNTDHYDQTHDFSAGLTHAFSERYQISVKDSLVIGQEPDMLRAGNTFDSFQRISGSNLRNFGDITFSAQFTPELGMELGYANTFFSYANNAPLPSLSGLLDELDNVAHLDLRYLLQPQTTGVFGYQFRELDYIGNQPIGFDPFRNQAVRSDERNARMNYLYLGLDHNFRPDLTGSFRVGGQYAQYYNNPASQDELSPYAMLNLKYTYLPESYLQAGFVYDYTPSSVFSVNNAGDLTLNAQSATVFTSLTHRITPKLFGNLLAQFQNSTYYGGRFDGQADNYYLVGLSLQYRFTPNFSAEVGYNYDNVHSDIPGRTYDRNRIYVGVTGSY
jgi:Putative beta-barrel porin 2